MIKTIKFILVFHIILTISACQNHSKQIVNDKEDISQNWNLQLENSTISIITTKNNSMAEVSHFTQFMGTINQNGKLTLNIDLNSLETNIPIRNERIQKHLFQTDIYKTADIHAQIKPEHLQPGIHKIAFDVDLHGLSALLNAEFMVLEQFGNKIVTLHKPLIINASTFGLENGVDVLRKLAHLDSINYTVPVNFILTFEVVK